VSTGMRTSRIDPGTDAMVAVSPRPPGGFSLVVSRALGTVVVTVHGELTVGGGELLDTMLGDLIEGDLMEGGLIEGGLIDGRGNQVVAVDLTHCEVGPTTPAVLSAAASRAHRIGIQFVVKERPPGPSSR
jgi:hypothetical protein